MVHSRRFPPGLKRNLRTRRMPTMDIWHREPVLRELVDRLDEQNPELNRLLECPYCHNHHIAPLGGHSEGFGCKACGETFVASTGTVFSNMRKDRYRALYRVLVLLWGQWLRKRMLPVSRISSVEQFLKYEKRLQPLFAELQGRPVTPRPRWLMGFTLGEQGVRCLHCQSSNVDTEGRTVWPRDEPKINCAACGHSFMLREWLRYRADHSALHTASARLSPGAHEITGHGIGQ